MPPGTEVGLGQGHIVLDGDQLPRKKGTSAPTFRPISIVAKLLGLDQDATWYRGRPRPWPHYVRWGTQLPQRGTARNFRPMSAVAKRLNGSRCHLVQG